MCRHPADARHKALDVRNRRLRQYTVTEIENKRTARECLNDSIDRTIECLPSDQQRERIEIALNRSPRLDVITRKGKVDGPIQADGVDRSRFKIRSKPRTSTTRKTDDLRPGDFFAHGS